jgi:uncharacterized protein (TIGR00369 family)
MEQQGEALRAQWLAQADAMRAQLAGPGIASREDLKAHSGIDFLRAIGAGKFPQPPIAVLLDFVPIEVEPGRMVFQGTPKPEHYNPIGSVHGGYIATLLDSAVACAIHSMLPVGKGYTTLELKLNFVRALTVNSGPVRAEGKVIHVGGQTGIAEGRLVDADGKLYAYASTTCLVFAIP